MIDPEIFMMTWNLCKSYLNADKQHKDAALALLDKEQLEAFLQLVALHRLLTDESHYKVVMQAMAGQMYEEFNREK